MEPCFFSETETLQRRLGGALKHPYRINRLEVSSRGWSCGGCCCGARCIGHPGREVYRPALKALRSHLHKGTTVGRAQRAVHWAWSGIWGTSFLLLPLWGIIGSTCDPRLSSQLLLSSDCRGHIVAHTWQQMSALLQESKGWAHSRMHCKEASWSEARGLASESYTTWSPKPGFY